MKSMFPRLAGWTLLILSVLVTICLAVALSFDWNRARPWISQRVSEATGRPFAIQGDLVLQWDSPEAETGWRRWVPWPRLKAQDITLGNAEWGKTGAHLAEIRQLTFSLNPLPLLNRTIRIPTLELDGPLLSLERTADGKNNWTLASGDTAPSLWKLELQRLVLSHGTVKLVDAMAKVDLKVDIDSLPKESAEGYGIGWKLSGTFRQTPVRGTGQAGAVLSLQQDNKPYPLQAGVQIGATRIDVAGTLTKPDALAALDLRLKLSGASMAHLYPITGITLPNTPPFSTEGHLVGKLDKAGGRWLYEHFKGSVGASDIAGTLEYISRQPRPLLRGQVQSNQLRLQDLAPLIGADSNASKARRGAAAVQPADKVLPVEKFDTASWGSIDADVKFAGRKILHAKDLPIESLVADLHLEDSVLSLTPLSFGVAGGTLAATARLDGRQNPIRANLQLSARRLKIKELFPSLDTMRASLGEVGGDAALSASGNSIAALLGTSNGEVKALVSKGTMSKFLLEAMGLNIGNVVATQLFGDRQVQLNCLASDFKVTQGVMQARSFVLDTDESVIDVTGLINLSNEQLALEIQPRNKALRVLSLRSPLYVKGTLKNPDVGVDKGAVALKLGAAVALGAVAPAAALLPLLNVGTQEFAGCAPLEAAASKKPQAPAVRPAKQRQQ
ncbi:AsmA family protein [Variovorax sp. V213]|uniref:AsmA family protein n=1 Tax=Variovorax sp. V213 TaxID=3065955 RepID=UPI0034E8D75F